MGRRGQHETRYVRRTLTRRELHSNVYWCVAFWYIEEDCYKGNADTNIIPAKTAQKVHGLNRFVAVGASLGVAGALVPGAKPYIEGKMAVENFAKNEFVRGGNNDHTNARSNDSNSNSNSASPPTTTPLAVVVKPEVFRKRKKWGRI